MTFQLIMVYISLQACVMAQDASCTKQAAPISGDAMLQVSSARVRENVMQTAAERDEEGSHETPAGSNHTLVEALDVRGAQAFDDTKCMQPRCIARVFEHGKCTGNSRLISDGLWNFDAGFNDVLTSMKWEKNDAWCKVDFFQDGWRQGRRYRSVHRARDGYWQTGHWTHPKVGDCWQLHQAGNDEATSAEVWGERYGYHPAYTCKSKKPACTEYILQQPSMGVFYKEWFSKTDCSCSSEMCKHVKEN
jgi:hypothetical protein